MILLKNGRIIDPDSKLDMTGDLLIDKDRIVDIAEKIDIDESNVQVIDCSGCVIGPGLVDIHVHFRDPGFTYKEDIESGARCAAAGGVTSVILMANTKPCVDSIETLEYIKEKAKDQPVHIYTCANITKGMQGKELLDFDEFLKNGAVGFTDDGIPLLDEKIVKQAMQEAAKYDTVLSFHEEDPEYIENNGVNHGKASEHFRIGGSDRKAEIKMVERDLKLALETGARINIQHISAKETLDLIREAKKNCKGSQNIFAEATPHHIALTEEATIEYGTAAKMNPPLRTEADRQAIIEAIKDDTIDFIATDHAPHSAEEKNREITAAPSGILGLETSLPVIYDVLVRENQISWLKVFCKMSTNPARLYGINAGKLAKNAIADVVVFDEKNAKVYTETMSKSKNSPFLGKKFNGRIALTICSGKIVYSD
ncbi:MAG: dihydroorotase [Lachnospiraceae bacterium]|nr:dihydroorotase [Lachnospiraceae bacterium]